jgi:hypothetical protein
MLRCALHCSPCNFEEAIMNRSKLARISALALVLFLFLSALPALAAPPCRCNICQRFPERTCRLEGTATTCLEFLIVALCPPLPPAATAAEAPSSKEVFLASLSGQPTQEPAASLNLTR